LSKKWGISMSPCNTVPCNFNCNAIWLDFADTTSLTLSGTNITDISNKGVFGGSFTNIAASAAACNAFSQNGKVTAQILQSNSFSNDITLPNQSRVIFVAMKASYSNTPSSGSWYTDLYFGSFDGGADIAILGYQSNLFGLTGFYLGEAAAGSNLNTLANLSTAINLSGTFNIFTYVVSSNTSLNRCAVNGVSYYLDGANLSADTYYTGPTPHSVPLHGNSYTTFDGVDYTYYSNISVWTTNLGEYLLYNGEMTRNQISQIENYLMAKWGVTPCNVGSGIQSTYRIPSMSTQPFSPTCVSNLSLWLDANDPFGSNYIPANSSSFATWYDKSGSNNNFNSTGSITFNQNPSRITFDGSSSMSNTSFTNQYYGMFIVFNNNSDGALFSSQLSGSASNIQLVAPNSFGDFIVASGSFINNEVNGFVTAGLTSNIVHIVYVGFTVNSTFYSINGTFSSNANTYAIPSTETNLIAGETRE